MGYLFNADNALRYCEGRKGLYLYTRVEYALLTQITLPRIRITNIGTFGKTIFNIVAVQFKYHRVEEVV